MAEFQKPPMGVPLPDERNPIPQSSRFELELPEGDNPWASAVRKHNLALIEARKRFGGEFFTRAPFDLIDATGRFIEVKVARYRHQHGAHQWRISLTSTEIRFARKMPVLLYLVWGENISLIPMSLWVDQLTKRALQRSRYLSNDRWSLVMDVPLDDLNQYLIHGLPTDLRAQLIAAGEIAAPPNWRPPMKRGTTRVHRPPSDVGTDPK